ncbi:MAG: hypothetical protein HOP22_10845 [Nitrospiraceae bacterium]|nr:hypothetical protein [Nitrospiraceae bacterium]
MDHKKIYDPPQLFRVELNQEQAILSACSLTTMSALSNSLVNGCRANGQCQPPGSPGGCKKSNVAGATCRDSGPRLS